LQTILYPSVLFLYPEVLDHDPKGSLLGAKDSSLVPVVLKRRIANPDQPGAVTRGKREALPIIFPV
jgi:hypothetical protein